MPFGKARRQRKAKAKPEKGGHLIQFIPGGFYHLIDGVLYTGVHRRVAAKGITETLLPLAQKASATPEEWVRL